MKRILCLMSLIMVFGSVPSVASDDKAAINALMDGFHEAASKADKDRYLGYFTKRRRIYGN